MILIRGVLPQISRVLCVQSVINRINGAFSSVVLKSHLVECFNLWYTLFSEAAAFNLKPVYVCYKHTLCFLCSTKSFALSHLTKHGKTNHSDWKRTTSNMSNNIVIQQTHKLNNKLAQ